MDGASLNKIGSHVHIQQECSGRLALVSGSGGRDRLVLLPFGMQEDPSSLGCSHGGFVHHMLQLSLFLVVLLCCQLPPKLGETAKVYR